MNLHGKKWNVPICAALVVLTVAAYGRVWELGFIGFDDPLYVTGNPEVLEGLTASGIAWAFMTTTCANWHPLTWMSLMLDASLAGDAPLMYHLTNVVLHLINVLLLFLCLRRLTGSPVRSAVVAALFAIHPLHVESVAWVSERKDVLSTSFWFLAMIAYAGYVAKPRAGRYLAVAGFLAAGLMAKPMLITLPLVLLLLDFWPLRRFEAGSRRPLLIEKLPLFLLAAVSAAVTIVVQRPAMRGLEEVPISERIANAPLSYIFYLRKMLWPSGLAIFYPYPQAGWSPWLAAIAAAALVSTTALAIMAMRRRPWLTVGWLWYIVTLLPVAGLIQVGSQARADRYTYIPLIGLFVLVAWSIPSPRSIPIGAAQAAITGAVLLTLAALTWVQMGYWRSDLELFTHTAEVTEGNAFAHFKLAEVRQSLGDPGAAEAELREALRIQPRYAKAHYNLTGLLAAQGRADDVEALCREEQERWPGSEQTLIDLGVLAFLRGRNDEAAARFEEALALDPASVPARHNLDALRQSAEAHP